MAGWLADRTAYVTLAGAGVVLAAILSAYMIFVGPGHSSTGPANPPPATTAAATPAPEYPESVAPERSSAEPPPETTARPPVTLPDRAVYVGRTEQSGIAIAVAVDGDRAAAYLCDGRRIEAWLTGRIDNGELRLSGRRGARLKGRLVEGRLVGDLQVRDRTYDYRVKPADEPAGLYRSQSSDGDIVIGWILLPDGSQVGLRSDPNGLSPAPEFEPGQPVRVGDQQLTVEEVRGDDNL